MIKPEDLLKLEEAAKRIPLDIEHLKGTIYKVTSCNDYYCILDFTLDASAMRVQRVMGRMPPYHTEAIDYNNPEDVAALSDCFEFPFAYGKSCNDILTAKYIEKLTLPYGYGARIVNMITNHMKSGGYERQS